MTTALDRLDILGEATERLHVISGALLDTQLDDELQAIAVEATQRLGMPIALVALLLRRMQYYRAYVGLPHEVEILRATDRCVGLCQHVLHAGHIVTFEDAQKAPVSQLLVDRYGIRAYIGAPVEVAGQMIGTLCCIDVRTRQFTDEDRATIHALSERVSHRLSELAEVALARRADGHARLRADADRLANEIALARISALELSPAMRIVEEALANDPARYAAWVDLPRVHADLQQALADLEATARRLRLAANGRAATSPSTPPSAAIPDEKNRGSSR